MRERRREKELLGFLRESEQREREREYRESRKEGGGECQFLQPQPQPQARRRKEAGRTETDQKYFRIKYQSFLPPVVKYLFP